VIMGSGFSRLITGTICMIGRGMIGGEYLCKWKGMFLEYFFTALIDELKRPCHVRLSYEPYFFSEGAVFFLIINQRTVIFSLSFQRSDGNRDRRGRRR
jgi:hypothetical protein